MGLMIILLDIYFLFYEFVIFMRDGFKSYFDSDFFNYIDLITSVMNTVLVFNTLTETEITYADRSAIKNWTALTIVLMWTNLFDWYNLLSSRFSVYWRIIKSTLVEISSVALIFLLLLMAFGNALMILNEGRYEDEQIFEDFF